MLWIHIYIYTKKKLRVFNNHRMTCVIHLIVSGKSKEEKGGVLTVSIYKGWNDDDDADQRKEGQT